MNIAKYDNLIEEFINDPWYHITEDGIVYTCLPTSGPKPTTEAGYKKLKWRIAGTERPDGCGLYYKYIRYKNIYLKAHRIVYRKFKGPLEYTKCINHIDNNGLNNHPDNLELVTIYENVEHCIKQNRNTKGEQISSKLMNSDVVKIKEILNVYPNYSNAEIGRMFNVGRETIRRIRHNILWKHITNT